MTISLKWSAIILLLIAVTVVSCIEPVDTGGGSGNATVTRV